MVGHGLGLKFVTFSKRDKNCVAMTDPSEKDKTFLRTLIENTMGRVFSGTTAVGAGIGSAIGSMTFRGKGMDPTHPNFTTHSPTVA